MLGTCLYPYGGADFGGIAAVAREVGEGDDSAFHTAWVSAGDRLAAEAETPLARGHRQSARELLLRASCFYALSYHPLYGEPVDPRLTAAFRAPLRIPFEGTTLPAYLVPAAGHEDKTRPLLILNNGCDASVTDLYFASAVAATRRGYHCLIFDGPGQGEMLILQGVRLRPDWETVIGSVRCPTLLTMAEHDSLSESAPEVYQALRCPKTLIRFTAAEGAGDHCEMRNRSLLNRRVLVWLDVTLQS
jgi:hypothetical protein